MHFIEKSFGKLCRGSKILHEIIDVADVGEFCHLGDSQFVCDYQKQFWLFAFWNVRLRHSFLQIKALCNNVKYRETSLTRTTKKTTKTV